MDTEALPISPIRLLDTLGTARAPLVLDVRRRPAFDADPAYAAGATWRDPFAVADWMNDMPRHRSIVAYCVHGHEVSRNVCAALRSAGLDARYLEEGLEGWRAAGGTTVRAGIVPSIPSGPGSPSRWVTRERPKIDRMACPWLVRRFIDPLAQFEYVPSGEVAAVAAATGAIAYDIPGVAFTHRGDRCSFDAIVEDFAIRDEALDRLATIVRGADTGRLDFAPEAAGLLAISRGLGQIFGDDHELMERGFVVYDALYADGRGVAARA